MKTGEHLKLHRKWMIVMNWHCLTELMFQWYWGFLETWWYLKKHDLFSPLSIVGQKQAVCVNLDRIFHVTILRKSLAGFMPAFDNVCLFFVFFHYELEASVCVHGVIMFPISLTVAGPRASELYLFPWHVQGIFAIMYQLQCLLVDWLILFLQILMCFDRPMPLFK